MSRIVAGAAGGTTLASVPGTATRPTSDRVKEALFSRLEAYGAISGASVLDLFAGSGALGVESASRGAHSVELVESAEKAAAVCRRNAERVNNALGRPAVAVHRAKADSFLAHAEEGARWDLVLMDPPYPLAEVPLAATLGLLAPRLAEGGVVVVERSSRSPEPGWPAGLEGFADKKYGETRLWFAEPA
jgi:16S rRNA (guanine966-N2)-methyltransferase